MKRSFLVYTSLLYFHFVAMLIAQQDSRPILLWPEGMPGIMTGGGSEKVPVYEKTGDHFISNIHNPALIPYIPSREMSSGIAVIIAPGGGHRELWIDHEGYNIAQPLYEKGIAAFILKYRLARDTNSVYSVEEHALKDMLRAIHIVRGRATEWHIDPDKIGVTGFSAGGQLAALADMHAGSGLLNSGLEAEETAGRPDFQALIYPGGIPGIIPTARSAPAFILGGYHDREDISAGWLNYILNLKGRIFRLNCIYMAIPATALAYARVTKVPVPNGLMPLLPGLWI